MADLRTKYFVKGQRHPMNEWHDYEAYRRGAPDPAEFANRALLDYAEQAAFARQALPRRGHP